MIRRSLIAAALLCVATPSHARDVRAIVTEEANAAGVPPRLAWAVAQVETRGRCHMTGRAGERGLMQVKPATARGVGVHGNLYDCRTGARAGNRYLAQALRKSGGHWGIASKLYNAGLYSAHVVSAYSRKVLAFAR